MSEPFDDLLKDGLLAPPDDFAARVMAQVDAAPSPEFAVPRRRGAPLQWIALAGAGLLGAAQLAAFLFGIWTATAAG